MTCLTTEKYHQTVALIAAGALLAPHIAPEATPEYQPTLPSTAVEHTVGATGLQSVVETVPGVTEHTSINGNIETKALDILDTRPFAPELSASPEAHDLLDPQQANTFTFAVQKDLTGQGYKPTGINFQGSASGEADVRKEDLPGAGEDTIDPENIRLANDRAKAVAETVVPTLGNLTRENVPVAFKQGVEVNRPDLATKEAELARELDKTPVELMQDWNRNSQSVPQDVRDTLDPLLGDRNVTIEVVGDRVVQKPAATPKTSQVPNHDTPKTPFWVYPGAVERPLEAAPTTGPIVSGSYGDQNERLIPNNAQAMQNNLQLAANQKQPRQANFNDVNRVAPKPLRSRVARSHGGNLGRPSK